MAAKFEEATLRVGGMDCASCVAHVGKAATRVSGVEACDVNLATGFARVKFDPDRTSAQRVAEAVSAAGYPAAARDPTAPQVHDHDDHAHGREWTRRAIIGWVLWFPVEATHWVIYLAGSHLRHGVNWMIWLSLITATLAMIFVGAGFFRGAWRALRRGTTDMDVLIAMGASVAYVYSLVALVGFLAGRWQVLPDLYFMEAAGLLALIATGHMLEGRARDKTGSEIRGLLELAPLTALKLRDDDPGAAPLELPVHELKLGDRVRVRPGDRVPIDGIVVSGRSSVNESMISGESMPVPRKTGDEVIGGTVNLEGQLVVRVRRTGSDTALAQIIRLVETAQNSKPAVQKLADKISAIFVPTVLGIAVLTVIGWVVAGDLRGWPTSVTAGLAAKAACSVLIIACPCALGLAVPAALMVGTGLGARRGILIRDIDALQHCERIDTVIFDKTGTLTTGRPAVRSIEPTAGFDEATLLALAASGEQFSTHPLAAAIVEEAQRRRLTIAEPEAFENIPGRGLRFTLAGRRLVVGSAEFVRAEENAAGSGTIVYVADEGGVVLGRIELHDPPRVDSATAIAELHAMKLRTVLLSGDRSEAARSVAAAVGIDEVHAGVRPDGKAEVIGGLRSSGRVIAMVGDGINDAPALASADLGIALGSGSDVAKETGGIVLLGDSLLGVAASLRLGRATMKVIRQNLFFAFIYNVLAIPLAAFGLLNPLFAAAAMALSDVTVLGNALRLRNTRLAPPYQSSRVVTDRGKSPLT